MKKIIIILSIILLFFVNINALAEAVAADDSGGGGDDDTEEVTCGANQHKNDAGECVCDTNYSRNSSGTCYLNCPAGKYNSSGSTCSNCPAGTYKAGAGNASSLCISCEGNTISAAGASACTACSGSYTYADKDHLVCCTASVTSSNAKGAAKHLSVKDSQVVVDGITIGFTNGDSACTMADGDAYSLLSTADKKGSSSGTGCKFTFDGSSLTLSITQSCKEPTCSFSLLGKQIYSSKTDTRPKWAKVKRVYGSVPSYNKVEDANRKGQDYAFPQDGEPCTKLENGRYECTVLNRSCGSSRPPGCYADPKLEKVRWLTASQVTSESVDKYYLLENVTQANCVNKCDSNDVLSEKVKNFNTNACSADKTYPKATFKTKCTNTNELIIHSKHPTLFSITCKEELNYKIQYYDSANNQISSGFDIKRESGIKAYGRVETTINCVGKFDRDAFENDWKLLKSAATYTELDNNFFWNNIMNQYVSENVDEYKQWLSKHSYVKRATDENDGFISTFTKGSETVKLINWKEDSEEEDSDTAIKVLCKSSNGCMEKYTPSKNSDGEYLDFDENFKYTYSFKLPASAVNNKYLVGNQLLLDKKLVNKKTNYSFVINSRNMGYYRGWSYKTTCKGSIDDTVKYHILGGYNDNPNGNNWSNSVFNFKCLVQQCDSRGNVLTG